MRKIVIAGAALVVLLAGCSSSGSSPDPQAASGSIPARAVAPAGSAKQQVTVGNGSDQSKSLPDTAGASTAEAAASDVTESASKEATKKKKKGLSPLDLPWKSTLPSRGRLTPTCVSRGDRIALHVVTEPGAAVGYQAVYQGNQGGGVPPFGAGHGGNDQGFATDKGIYDSAWTIGPKAPFGRARVDVILSYGGDMGYVHPFFKVVPAGKSCS